MSEIENQKYVIFDHDGGTDDAWALLMLLQAEKLLKNIKLLAITCVNGNTTIDNAIKNTYHILRLMDRTDIPIYKGLSEAIISRPFIRTHKHGINGLGNVEFWKPDYPSNESELVRPENAVQTIRDLIMRYPNQIALIGVGPLTNLALTVKLYPEIKDKVEHLYLMGGNLTAQGNELFTVEFNFSVDPEAAHIVLNKFECPITLLPFETCSNHCLTSEWRFNAFKDVESTTVQLLNKAEEFVYQNRSAYRPCDAYLMALFLFPDKCIKKQNRRHVSIELIGIQNSQLNSDQMETNHFVDELLHTEELQRILHWTATA